VAPIPPTQNLLGEIFADRYSFTGRELNQGFQLYYSRSRIYDSNAGLFTSQDSIGFAGQDSNLSRYVSNSPIDSIDPTGESVIEFVIQKPFQALLITGPILGLVIFAVLADPDDPFANGGPGNPARPLDPVQLPTGGGGVDAMDAFGRNGASSINGAFRTSQETFERQQNAARQRNR